MDRYDATYHFHSEDSACGELDHSIVPSCSFAQSAGASENACTKKKKNPRRWDLGLFKMTTLNLGEIGMSCRYSLVGISASVSSAVGAATVKVSVNVDPFWYSMAPIISHIADQDVKVSTAILNRFLKE